MGFSFRLGLFFAAVFLVMGTQLPFLPLWLDWRGLSAFQIGLVSSAPLFVRIIATPAIAFAADRLGDHRAVLIVLAWAGTGMLVLLNGSTGFWPIFGVVLAFSICWTTIMPLTETIAMAGVKVGGHDYGRMRLWGSASFILASFAGGIAVSKLGAGVTVWLLVIGGVATIISAHLLPHPVGRGRLKGAISAPRLKPGDALGLLYSPLFLLFLLAAGMIQASHAVLYFFGSLHWQTQGISSQWVGVLWAIGIITEIALFAWSGAVVRYMGVVRLIMVGAVAGMARWLVMGFDPPLAVLLPLQVLHGLTYGASHLGAIHFIAKAVDETRAGTAQALYASVTAGILMGAATLMSGELYSAFHGHAYWAMAVMCVVGAAACLVLLKIWDCGLIDVSRMEKE